MVFVMPELFEVILQDIGGCQSLVQCKLRFQSGTFFITKVLPVLQKELFVSLYDLLSRFSDLPVFTVSNFVDHPVGCSNGV